VAIGKRLTDPIKVVSMSCDTAIDREKTPLGDYAESRDASLVVALPGQTLTWFTLRPITGDLVATAKSYPRPVCHRVAFALACTACSDPGVLAPGAWRGDGAARTLRDDAIDELPDQLWDELGHVALQLGGLTRGEGLRFVPLAGLRVIRRPQSGTTAPSAESKTPAPREG
jgi:hypothetical protein